MATKMPSFIRQFRKLQAEHVRLTSVVAELRGRLDEQAREQHLQFVRMAQMQAILDEEYRSGVIQTGALRRDGLQAERRVVGTNALVPWPRSD